MQLVILLIAARLATIIVARITIEFGSSKRRTSAQQQQVRPTKLSSNAGDHLPDERWQAKSDAEEAAPPPPPPFVGSSAQERLSRSVAKCVVAHRLRAAGFGRRAMYDTTGSGATSC